MWENFAKTNKTDRKRKRRVGQTRQASIVVEKSLAGRDCCIKMRLVGANLPEG